MPNKEPQKTLKYQLNESYAEGFNDAVLELANAGILNCYCEVAKQLCPVCRYKLKQAGSEI